MSWEGDGDKYTSYTYKLRSAGPVPVDGNTFVTQTFGVDKSAVKTYTATTVVNSSGDMAGLSLLDDAFISASWQRLPYLNSNNSNVFSGATVSKPDFVNEDQIT